MLILNSNLLQHQLTFVVQFMVNLRQINACLGVDMNYELHWATYYLLINLQTLVLVSTLQVSPSPENASCKFQPRQNIFAAVPAHKQNQRVVCLQRKHSIYMDIFKIQPINVNFNQITSYILVEHLFTNK